MTIDLDLWLMYALLVVIVLLAAAIYIRAGKITRKLDVLLRDRDRERVIDDGGL